MWDVYSEAWKWYPLCTKVPRSLHKFALCWWLSIDNGKVWDIVIQVPLWKDITWYIRFVGSVFPDNWGLLLNIYNLRLCCLYSCFENITILCKHVTPKIPKSINRYLKKKSLLCSCGLYKIIRWVAALPDSEIHKLMACKFTFKPSLFTR